MSPPSETHFKGSAVVRDIILGMSDGLTVPFALAAGLAGAVSSSFLVLVAGIAELTAGSISMGLGGYLAARAKAYPRDTGSRAQGSPRNSGGLWRSGRSAG